MGGVLLAKDSEGNSIEDDDGMFCSGRGFFEDIKGFMIRAAIAYLKDLQSKRLTKERLINEGMLGSGHIDTEPEVVVKIYQGRLQEGIDLLNTWVREPDPSAPDPWFQPGAMKCLLRHTQHVIDTGCPLDSWTNDQNYNYHFGPIHKWSIPVVLKRLKMAGVWHYARGSWGELEPYHCQEIVAFLDRVMPFFEEQFKDSYEYDAKRLLSDIKEFKRVFELCPEDGSVILS